MNPLTIALQGLGFAATLVALQGFAPVNTAVEAPKYYSAGVDALRRQQLEEDEVILTIVQQFVMEA